MIQPFVFDELPGFVELGAKGLFVAAVQMGRHRLEVDLRHGSQHVGEVRRAATVELRRDEYLPIGGACGRRP